MIRPMQRQFCFTAFLLLSLLVLASPLLAHDIQVVAVFSDRAVLTIDGERIQLQTGDMHPSGITLLATDVRNARVRLQIDQNTQELGIGGRIGGQYQTPARANARVYRDSQGSFTATGSINGFAVRFLVDTGASAVVISATLAKRLNIDYTRGTLVSVATASGIELGYQINFSQVGLGNITQDNVSGLVLTGDAPHIALLGMSFLNRINLRNEADALILEQRF